MTVVEPSRVRSGDAPAVGAVFARVQGRVELALAPIELHAHQLLSRPLDEDELAEVRRAADGLVRALSRLQHHGVVQPARRITELLEVPDPGATTGAALASAIEDTRTMLASAVAQLDGRHSATSSILAIGPPTAAFDTMMWVLAHHGNAVRHDETVPPVDDEPPDAVIVHVGSDPEPALRTVLPAVAETYECPVVILHGPLPVATRAALARYCAALVEESADPAVVSDEILRLRAAAATRLDAVVWAFDEAARCLRAHGYDVVEIDRLEDLESAPAGALAVGTGAGERAMHGATRLLRVSPATRRVPVVWEGPLSAGRSLAAARLGALVVEHFDDRVAALLTSELRRAAAEVDPTAVRPDTALAWPAARLLIDRSLIAAQRSNTPVAVGVVRLEAGADPGGATEVAGLLTQEFRRGDVVGQTEAGDFAVALGGIGERIAIDRFSRLAPRLADGTRIGVAAFPTNGRSADDLVLAAIAALERARVAGGPMVVGTTWRPEETRPVDVLTVDPDVVLGETIAAALAETGLRVEVMADGNEALRHLVGLMAEELPRLLVVDLDLGGAEGRALLRGLDAAGVLQHVRVIALASKTTESDMRIALDLGASDVVRKPFPITILQHRIAQLLSS